MGLRRIGFVLVLVAALGVACGGDESGDNAAISLDEPIGSVQGSGSAAQAAAGSSEGASVAKSAFAAMRVPKDELASSAQAVVDLATTPQIGGFLVSSVFDSQEGHGSAHVMVKVPSARFETTVAKLDGIGEVTRQELSGQDLTPQVVDAQTRLQRERARMADIIRQLEAASDEAAAFRLREQLRAARARLRAARQGSASVGTQVAFATVDVALRATPPRPRPEKPVIERAFATAKSLTAAIASGAILIAGVAVPLLALLAVVLLVAGPVLRRLKPRLHGWPN